MCNWELPERPSQDQSLAIKAGRSLGRVGTPRTGPRPLTVFVQRSITRDLQRYGTAVRGRHRRSADTYSTKVYCRVPLPGRTKGKEDWAFESCDGISLLRKQAEPSFLASDSWRYGEQLSGLFRRAPSRTCHDMRSLANRRRLHLPPELRLWRSRQAAV